mmetsp:Transcript_13264/g.33714  ORF Transcript_13264/g.33714 Transcript_13264/m.33714 type:complete len:289 (-) Transcript_13264:627-1493(-)
MACPPAAPSVRVPCSPAISDSARACCRRSRSRIRALIAKGAAAPVPNASSVRSSRLEMLMNRPRTTARAPCHRGSAREMGAPQRHTACTIPCAPHAASSERHAKTTSAPCEAPTRVTGRLPAKEVRSTCRASAAPHHSARALACLHSTPSGELSTAPAMAAPGVRTPPAPSHAATRRLGGRLEGARLRGRPDGAVACAEGSSASSSVPSVLPSLATPCPCAPGCRPPWACARGCACGWDEGTSIASARFESKCEVCQCSTRCSPQRCLPIEVSHTCRTAADSRSAVAD